MHPEAGPAVIGERATVGAGVEIHRHTLPHQVSFGLGDVVDPVAQMIQSGTVRGVPRAARWALDELEIRWSLGGEGEAVVPVAEPALADRAEGNAQRTGGIVDRLVDVAALWSWRRGVLV